MLINVSLNADFFVILHSKKSIRAMKIWYLGHSGFALECGNGCTLVFDFYTDVHQVLPDVLSRSSTVYVFASHSHPDHFNHRIFQWEKAYTSTQFTYIIANEQTRKREFGNLESIKDNYPKFVISMTPLVRRNDENGITHLSLRTFLLSEEL